MKAGPRENQGDIADAWLKSNFGIFKAAFALET